MLDLLIIGALATYGMSYAITSLEGPFGVFARIRGATDQQRNWIERGLHCVICVSFWIGLPVALIINGFTAWALVNWLGYLGLSCITTVVLNRLRAR
jgi:hypothetical protein